MQAECHRCANWRPRRAGDVGRNHSPIGRRPASLFNMQARTITVPELALIGSTRIALGAGIGLLLAQRITRRQRKAAGLALLGFGAITTIPLVMEVLGKRPVAAQ